MPPHMSFNKEEEEWSGYVDEKHILMKSLHTQKNTKLAWSKRMWRWRSCTKQEDFYAMKKMTCGASKGFNETTALFVSHPPLVACFRFRLRISHFPNPEHVSYTQVCSFMMVQFWWRSGRRYERCFDFWAGYKFEMKTPW